MFGSFFPQFGTFAQYLRVNGTEAGTCIGIVGITSCSRIYCVAAKVLVTPDVLYPLRFANTLAFVTGVNNKLQIYH
jgi:hypothetical protein